MSKLITVISNERIVGYMVKCPGCNDDHFFRTVKEHSNNPVWTFDGNHDKPTFNPSLRCRYPKSNDKGELCHFFLTNGEFRFLADSTHKLAGATVPMIEYK